ncbi:uncharacterized protein LOC125261576 isoform X2 [Megalobrama amblycephala]|uniref:uncharacterized protein LOC125261576 isoform X2 n=1 Tax=Megalobrama amblycephala TaxID=75352 RepID=UPI00201472B0|nr:uncharacterized protein LOC125261576 isoform X2 [Megalobrama amblycephala]
MTLRRTAMGADNVLLFILVWTFTAVCQADDDVCSVSCEDVTGDVGKEANLTCNVSQKCSECCIRKYRFQYPEKYDSTICREDLPEGSCEQRNSFTCRYTPTTEMMRQFRFLVKTIKCGPIKTESTVNKADGCSVSCKNVTVGKEANLTCSVSQNCSECCIEKYKFYYTENYNDNKVICRQELPLGSCEQRNNFTCRYTPTKAMTGRFRFYVQTTCGLKLTVFTVDITEHNKQTGSEDPGSTAPMFPGAVVGCFIIIFIIGMSVFCVKRFKRSNPSGSQMKYERGASEEPTITTVKDQNETK